MNYSTIGGEVEDCGKKSSNFWKSVWRNRRDSVNSTIFALETALKKGIFVPSNQKKVTINNAIS